MMKCGGNQTALRGGRNGTKMQCITQVATKLDDKSWFFAVDFDNLESVQAHFPLVPRHEKVKQVSRTNRNGFQKERAWQEVPRGAP